MQKGIPYAPDHHFFAFEVRVNDARFLDFDVGTKLLERAGSPLVAKPIRQGSFEYCISIDVDSLQTRILRLLNLPPCRDNDIVKGIVVRPKERQPQSNLFLKLESWR